MNLKEFIEETLVSIVDGTESAQVKLSNAYPSYKIYGETLVDNRKYTSKIEFDVAITASNTIEDSKNGGLKIAVLNLGADDKKIQQDQAVSRIKFNVTLSKPTGQ